MLSMDSVPWECCDMSADVAVEKIHHRLAEWREVERRRLEIIVVHDDRFVHPDAAVFSKSSLMPSEPVTRLPLRIFAEMGIHPP